MCDPAIRSIQSTMPSRSTSAFRASSSWVIPAAFVLALVSIVVVTTLQRRANSTRDAQVMLGKIAGEVDLLQSVPFDANGQDAAAQAAVRRHLRTSEQRIEGRLAQLRRDHPSSHLSRAEAPFRANMVTLNRIQGHVARQEDAEADALGPIGGAQQRLIGRELRKAGVDYEHHASRSLTFAMFGTTGMILALVSLFAVFYVRWRKSARVLLEDSQLEVIQRLALAAEYRDDETGQHTRRVGELSARIGHALRIADDELLLLRQAAPLHDVGKIAIPDSILLKPGALSPGEFEQMKTHTTRGAAMLTGAGFALLEMAETIALTHHERWDGTGYPSGLSGPAIPLVGRIVAIADVFDALTHSRPYKEAWTVADALTEIGLQSGGQFDPDVVDAFLRVQPDLADDTDETPADSRDHEVGSASGAPAVAAAPA